MEKCAECGSEMILSKGPGRTRNYRGKSGYEIPANLEYPICPNCGAEWMTASQIDVLSESLERQREFREIIEDGLNFNGVKRMMES